MVNPRGIRNNNPGNLRHGSNWQGLAAQQTDKDFCMFAAPAWGIRAMARTLQTYAEVHGLRTLRGIVNRWAPPTENDTSSYLTAVCIYADRMADEPLDVTDHATVLAVVKAITRIENGKPPADRPPDWYDAATWEKGLRLAGLAPSKPLAKSRQMRANAIAATGASGVLVSLLDGMNLPPGVVELLPTLLADLTEQQVAVISALVAIGAQAWAAYARADDKRNGRL